MIVFEHFRQSFRPYRQISCHHLLLLLLDEQNILKLSFQINFLSTLISIFFCKTLNHKLNSIHLVKCMNILPASFLQINYIKIFELSEKSLYRGYLEDFKPKEGF